MNRNKGWLLFAALPLLVATLAQAQGLPTGTLSGRVGEPDGLALPGVTVTAKSPALQGTRTAVTNVNGDYVLPNLPPGEYLVTFVMSGFQNVTRNVKVSSGQQVPLNAAMSLSAVAAETTVVAASETVSQTAQAATTLSFDTAKKLPVARNLLGSVVLAAGVNANGPNAAVTISGAQSYDNVMTVNGVNVQDNLRGTPNNLFIEDAIQETTTMTSGVSAEFGRFTGGVVNAVTKQGGNAFSGSFRVSLNNDDWQSQPPIPVTYTDKVVPTYEATLGGPILTDRVWFFAAGRYNKQELAGQTSAPTNVSFPRVNTDERYEGKLTLTPFQSHTFTGSYTNSTVEQDGYYFLNLPILDTSILHSRQLPNDLLSVNYNGVLSGNLFVEAQYSRKQFTFENSGSRVNELIGGTAVLVQDQGFGQMYSPIFCAVCPGSAEERNNDDYLVKGTWFLSTKSLGSHNVVFGFDDFGAQRKSNNWQSGSSWLLYPTSVRYEGGVLYPVVDSSSYLVYAPIPETSQGSDIRTISLFVNDTWRLNDRLSFNVGLRWDKNDATDASGATTAKDSAFSPRLAASWDVRADGRLRLSGSYARYVGQVQENLAGSGATGAGAPASYYYYWAGAPINAGAGSLLPTDEVLRRMYAALGVTGLNQFPNVPADTATVPGVNLLIRDSLQSPYADEFVLGVGGTLGSNLVYRVDGIYRKFTNFYSTRRDTTTGQVEDSVGNVYDLGLYENSKEPEREYAGLHSSLAFRKGALNLSANWTWSRMRGNFVGENAGSGPLAATFDNYPEYIDLKWNAPRGDLSQDQRHRVRLMASYDFRVGGIAITPGLVQQYDTGTPYGAVGNVNSRSYVTNPGYVAPPATVPYYFTARDAYRTDDIWATNLSLNLSANLGPVELFVQPQVLNVFDQDGVLAPNTSVLVGTGAAPNSNGLVRFDPFNGTPVECPQAASAAECSAMGANWKKGPNFGKATTGAANVVSRSGSFQGTRLWFVSMGVRF